MKLTTTIGLAAAGLVLASCASVETPNEPASCAPGERPADVVQMFFGRNIGPTPGVSEKDWDSFLDTEVVSRFPEGLSVIDTAGVWRGKDGDMVHELAKAVVIVLSGRPDEQARLKAVADAYKTRFSQEAVLTARSRSCVAF